MGFRAVSRLCGAPSQRKDVQHSNSSIKMTRPHCTSQVQHPCKLQPTRARGVLRPLATR